MSRAGVGLRSRRGAALPGRAGPGGRSARSVRAVPAPSRGERPAEAPDRKLSVCSQREHFHKLPAIQVLQDLSLLPYEHLSRPFAAPAFVGYILRSSTLPLCPLFQVFCLLKTLNALKHLSLNKQT